MIPRGNDLLVIVGRYITDQALHDKLINLYVTLAKEIEFCPAAIKHHHWWKKGWLDHTAQVLKISIDIYNNMSEYEPITDFTIDDVILVAFVHDLDKLWRYTELEKPKEGQLFEYRNDITPYTESSKVVAECFRHGIELTDQHIEAIDHHHGGYSVDISSVYSKSSKTTKLSTLIHCADMLSTFMWGKNEAKNNA